MEKGKRFKYAYRVSDMWKEEFQEESVRYLMLTMKLFGHKGEVGDISGEQVILTDAPPEIFNLLRTRAEAFVNNDFHHMRAWTLCECEIESLYEVAFKTIIGHKCHSWYLMQAKKKVYPI